MALSYTQIPTLATSAKLLSQMQVAIAKQAFARVAASCTGAEFTLSTAIIRTPAALAGRFVQQALILNAATLISTNGTSLDVDPSDAAMDGAVLQQWQAQVSSGV